MMPSAGVTCLAHGVWVTRSLPSLFLTLCLSRWLRDTSYSTLPTHGSPREPLQPLLCRCRAARAPLGLGAPCSRDSAPLSPSCQIAKQQQQLIQQQHKINLLQQQIQVKVGNTPVPPHRARLTGRRPPAVAHRGHPASPLLSPSSLQQVNMPYVMIPAFTPSHQPLPVTQDPQIALPIQPIPCKPGERGPWGAGAPCGVASSPDASVSAPCSGLPRAAAAQPPSSHAEETQRLEPPPDAGTAPKHL